MDVKALAREEKSQKKLRRIAKAGAWSVGIGIGLLIARLIAPLFIAPAESTDQLFLSVSMALVGYGLFQLGAVLFIGKHATKIDSVLTYLIMPAVLIKIFMDYSS